MQKITSITKESLIKSFHDTLSDGFSSVGNDALGFNQRFPESEQVIKMYSVAEFKNILELKLSKKRYIHSLNVADEARKLAEHYGYCDTDKAYLAGLLHDVCKEIPQEAQLEMVLKSDRSVSDAEKCTPALFHAVAGAYYAETVFGFTDEDFLNSIRYHTVGRAGMSRLEEIVYIADLTSAERDYKDVDKMRRYSRQSIEKAMLEALTFSIESVMKKGSLIPVHTTEAYNFYRSALNEKNGKKTD